MHNPPNVLNAGHALSLCAVPITHDPLDSHTVLAGHPTAGFTTLTTLNNSEIGVWEMTAGTATDVEQNEIFIVISGQASIYFADTDHTIEVGPGDLVELVSGMRTTWTVTETLRKVYVA